MGAPPGARRIEYRPAIAVDAPVLSDIAFRAKAHWGYDEAFMEMCREELTITPARIAGEHMELAMIDGAVAGFSSLIYQPGDAVGEVEDIFVLPDFMGLGLGRGLMENLKAEARRRGATALEADADPNARGYYERMGFRLFSQSPSQSVPGRMLPRLRCALGAA